VNGDRVIEVLLSCTHCDRNRQSLKHFIDTPSDANDSDDDLIGGGSIPAFQANNLEHRLLLFGWVSRRRVEHVDESALVCYDICLTVLADGLLLR